MTMIFYERCKLPNCDDAIVRIMNPEYNPKPSVGEQVIINDKLYKVCAVVINYDERSIYVMMDVLK